jgi:surface antigen
MCNINRKLKDLIPVLICSLILIISLPAYAYKNNPKSTYVTGVAASGYIGSRNRDYYRKRNHNRVSIGLNFGYPIRYTGSYIGFRYHYPLSYRRNYNDWRYNDSSYYRQNYDRSHNNSNQLIATTTGVFIGALIGSKIGRYLDEVDRIRARDANIMAQTSPIGQRISWSNPQSNHYGNTIATRDGHSKSGKYCREFYQTISIGNRTEKAYGTACRQPDGSWQLVQALN